MKNIIHSKEQILEVVKRNAHGDNNLMEYTLDEWDYNLCDLLKNILKELGYIVYVYGDEISDGKYNINIIFDFKTFEDIQIKASLSYDDLSNILFDIINHK